MMKTMIDDESTMADDELNIERQGPEILRYNRLEYYYYINAQ